MNPKLKQITDNIINHLQILKNYKKRRKLEMKAKTYQQILFRKPIKDSKNNISKALEPRLISINYLVLYNLLPITNENCPLCKEHRESTNHLLFECNKTHKIRQKLATYLSAAGNAPQTKINIKEMNDLQNLIEIQIISIYKQTIWNFRNLAYHKLIDPNAIERKFTTDLNFYLKHIL